MTTGWTIKPYQSDPKYLNVSYDGNLVLSAKLDQLLLLQFALENYTRACRASSWNAAQEYGEMPAGGVPAQSAPAPAEKKCTCSSYDLFNFGCKCGGK